MVEFDAVYPYVGGNNYELRCSIALLKRHARGLRGIYIIGDDPEIEGVTVIPYIQTDVKETNIWKKTLTACFEPAISDRFLFINDDHFILEPFEDLPYYYEGEIGGHIGSKQYEQAEDRTAVRLSALGYDTRYYDIHCPMFIEKAKFIEVYRCFSDAEYIMKSAYCNFHRVEGVEMADQKCRTLYNYDEIRAEIAGRWVFSTSELTMTIGVKKLLAELTGFN